MRLLFAVTLLLALAPSLAQAKRIALIIGNDAYSNLPPHYQLQKARNDARATAQTFEKIGFEVLQGFDLNRRQMNVKLSVFADKIEPGDEVLFFFAGHGVRIEGQNYLLPSDIPDIDNANETLLRSESLRVDEVTELLRKRGARLSILVLDACRNNPYKNSKGRAIGGSRGLAAMDPPEGTLVLFSAGAGQEALDRLDDNDPNPNSVFTRTFLPLVEQEGLELARLSRQVKAKVRDLAKTVHHRQTPAVYNEVIGDVFLSGKGAQKPKVSQQKSADETLWATIETSNKISDFDFYLKEHPKGRYSSVAKLKRQRLQQQKLALNTPSKVEENPKEESDAEALFQKGEDYFYGKNGKDIDLKQTLMLSKKAAFLGHGGAMYRLGSMYKYGYGVEKNEAMANEWGQKATPLVRQAAENGDADYMFFLGVIYREGLGINQDYHKTIEWFKKAANLNNAIAMYTLGNMHLKGEGIKQDSAIAVEWFKKAADKGNTYAMYRLGLMYENGNGVGQDLDLASQWYQKAADKGVSEAVKKLAKIKTQKAKIEKDKNNQQVALHTTTKLKYQDTDSKTIKFKPSNLLLANKFFLEAKSYYSGSDGVQDYAKALEMYLKAAENGSIEAMDAIGIMYKTGQGVPKNAAKAAQWFERAKLEDSPYKMYNKAYDYSKGRGVKKNYVKAIYWYKKSAEFGDTDAMYNLALLYSEGGYGATKNPNQAAFWMFKALKEKGSFSFKQMTTNHQAWGKPFRRELQKKLNEAGLYHGKIDGKFGPGTIRAIKELAGQ